jgi:structural maintenance of chromosomes protein 5
LARAIISEQTENTRTGLEYVQVGANKAALKDLCERKDEKYQSALAEFNKGRSEASAFHGEILTCVILCLVDQAFNAVKAASKQALDDSRLILNGVSPELREEYQAIEDVRAQYDKDVAVAEKEGLSPPSPEGVDLRSLDELRAELETQQANLDLNLATNPGVVEQYEKRKRDVCDCLLSAFMM